MWMITETLDYATLRGLVFHVESHVSSSVFKPVQVPRP